MKQSLNVGQYILYFLNAFQYDWFTFFKTCGLQEERCNEYKEKFIEHRLCHLYTGILIKQDFNKVIRSFLNDKMRHICVHDSSVNYFITLLILKSDI